MIDRQGRAGSGRGWMAALAYAVAFSDGRVAQVLVSLDGGTYRIGKVAVSGETRIAVAIARNP